MGGWGQVRESAFPERDGSLGVITFQHWTYLWWKEGWELGGGSGLCLITLPSMALPSLGHDSAWQTADSLEAAKPCTAETGRNVLSHVLTSYLPSNPPSLSLTGIFYGSAPNMTMQKIMSCPFDLFGFYFEIWVICLLFLCLTIPYNMYNCKYYLNNARFEIQAVFKTTLRRKRFSIVVFN